MLLKLLILMCALIRGQTKHWIMMLHVAGATLGNSAAFTPGLLHGMCAFFYVNIPDMLDSLHAVC